MSTNFSYLYFIRVSRKDYANDKICMVVVVAVIIVLIKTFPIIRKLCQGSLKSTNISQLIFISIGFKMLLIIFIICILLNYFPKMMLSHLRGLVIKIACNIRNYRYV
jgi:hypothetical protein